MILVTGATGRVGRQVAARLDGSRRLSRSAVGTNAVAGDLTDLKVLDEALADVDRVFLLWPMGPVETAEPVVDLIAQRAEHVVFLSSMTVGMGLTDHITEIHRGVENLIRASGLDWTFVRAGGFATNLLWDAERIRSGVVRKPYGEASRSLVHDHDLAAVAARALRDAVYVGRELDVTGPEAVTHRRQVEIIGEVVGRPVRWEEVPREEALATMLTEGWEPEMAAGVLDYFDSLVTEPEPVTWTVEQVTGVPARTFRRWAEDHADAFR